MPTESWIDFGRLPLPLPAAYRPFAPIFINLWDFTKSQFENASSFAAATIVSRDSDTQFTVSSGHGSRIAASGGVVVKDDVSDRHYSFMAKSVASDVVTIADGVLPATISTCQQMHDAANGQHLSALGYKGLADFVCDQVEKWCRKDELLFAYNPAVCSTTAFSNPDIYNSAATVKIIDVTTLGTAAGGGFVTGTGNLTRLCQQQTAVVGIDSTFPQYMSKHYTVQDAVSGNGMKFDIPVDNVDGYLEVVLSGGRVTYDTTQVTGGDVRLVVKADGVDIHDQTYPDGVLHFVRIDFSGATTLTLEMKLAASVPTSARLHFVQAWRKAPSAADAMPFEDGGVLGFFGDSWLQGTGVDTRLAQRLSDDGITVSTVNLSRAGQTSAWGLYWIAEMIAQGIDVCFINFWVNDYNSIGNVAGHTASSYDFSPTDRNTSQLSNAGGVFGSVTAAQWYANIEAICDALIAARITPIVFMPGHTASSSQAQGIQRGLLARIATGFEPVYTDGGGT